MDEFVDSLLVKSRVCATTLPKLNPRMFLEDEGRLEPRESALGEELDELDGEDVKMEDSDGEEDEMSESEVDMVEGRGSDYEDGSADDRPANGRTPSP